MLKVLHSSDLHGKYKALLKAHKDSEFDVWLDTGDFFPNVGRVPKTGNMILDVAERAHQSRWWGWKMLGARFTEWLDGRPAIIMPGNHDFISLYAALLNAGADAHLVTPAGVEVAGLKWAGFREIIQANADPEWMGEVGPQDEDRVFRELTEQTFASNPDVLVTHAPPNGILNPQGEDYGIKDLTRSLAYQPHQIKAHFFGHDHWSGGEQAEEMGVLFFNGAKHALIHELP